MIGKIKTPASTTPQEKQKKQLTLEMVWSMTKLSLVLSGLLAVAILVSMYVVYQNSLVSTEIAKHVEEHQLVLNRVLCDDLGKVYNVYTDACLTPEQDLKVRAWMVENTQNIVKA